MNLDKNKGTSLQLIVQFAGKSHQQFGDFDLDRYFDDVPFCHTDIYILINIKSINQIKPHIKIKSVSIKHHPLSRMVNNKLLGDILSTGSTIYLNAVFFYALENICK